LSAREAREGKVDRTGERIRQSERIIADGGQIEFSMAVELNSRLEARGSSGIINGAKTLEMDA